jgi:hypothetical protein
MGKDGITWVNKVLPSLKKPDLRIPEVLGQDFAPTVIANDTEIRQ